jgi:hypothetical protein
MQFLMDTGTVAVAVEGRHARFRHPASEPVKATPILIDGKVLIIGHSFTN